MPIAEALGARHERDLRVHARADLRLDGIPHHVLAEEQRTVGGEVDVRQRTRAKLATSDHATIAMDVEHHELLTVERPKNARRIEIQTAHQMSRVREQQLALR